MTRPLTGIRVLDLTTVGPGARCAAMLADLGADVVKVGPPAAAARIVPDDCAYSAGRGARRIGMDLKHEAGRDAALVRRASTGEGTVLDVAAVDGMLSLMSLSLDRTLATDAPSGPGADVLSGRYACYGLYRCADDRWLSVGAIEPKFWANLCRALDCEQWIDHQRDDTVQDAVRADLVAAFARHDRDDWVARLGPADTCVAPVLDLDEVPEDPHLADRFVDVELDGDRWRQTGRVLAGSEPTSPERGTAARATRPHDVLGDAGLSDDDIDRLLAEEVVS